MTKNLLDVIGKPGTSKDMLLSKMAKIPMGYTHMGLANTEVGLTAVVGAEDRPPLVWEPKAKNWVPLMRKTDGGVIV